MVLEMFFLLFSNAYFRFKMRELTWRSYIIAKTLPPTSWVKLIDKKEFAKKSLEGNFETFVVYVTNLEVMPVYLSEAYHIQDEPILAVL